MKSVSELPLQASVSGILCRPDGALIFGLQGGEFHKGDLKLIREATLFEVSSEAKPLRPISVGEGRARSVSAPSLNVIYVVRTVPSPTDSSEQNYLSTSVDGGASWEAIETAPDGIIGVAFASDEAGFAWSEDAVYRSNDGGLSWKGVDSPGVLSRGAPFPVIDSDGALWVATGHGPGWSASNNVVARVLPNLDIETKLHNSKFQVWEMDISHDGVAWLLTEGADAADLTLMRLDAGKTKASVVSHLPKGIPDYFGVFGSEIVVLEGIGAPQSPKSILRSSKDQGKSWKNWRLPERIIETGCALNADQIWLVGSSGQVYAP